METRAKLSSNEQEEVKDEEKREKEKKERLKSEERSVNRLAERVREAEKGCITIGKAVGFSAACFINPIAMAFVATTLAAERKSGKARIKDAEEAKRQGDRDVSRAKEEVDACKRRLERLRREAAELEKKIYEQKADVTSQEAKQKDVESRLELLGKIDRDIKDAHWKLERGQDIKSIEKSWNAINGKLKDLGLAV